MDPITHSHTGQDSPRISAEDIDGLVKNTDTMNTLGAQTVADIKTFSDIPEVTSLPENDNDMVNKEYIDSISPDYDINTSSVLIDHADTLRHSDDVAYTEYKRIEFKEENGSDITVKFDLRDTNGAGTSSARIYKNSVAVGIERVTGSGWATYSEDLSGINTDDEIQLYMKTDTSGGGAGADIRNFRLYYKKDPEPILGTVIMN